MNLGLKGKVAIVTGGSEGIGRATAGSLGREGSPGTLDEFYTENARRSGIPLGRVGEAEEVGDLIAFLCSSRGAYISGVSINMDGGSSAVV